MTNNLPKNLPKNMQMIKAFAMGYAHGWYGEKEVNPFVDKYMKSLYSKGFGDGILDRYLDTCEAFSEEEICPDDLL